MAGFGERFGRWDDRSGATERGTGWWIAMYLVVGGVTSVVIAALTGVVGAAAYGIVAGVALLWVVGYVVWRRRRNRRLTGSPTTWPT